MNYNLKLGQLYKQHEVGIEKISDYFKETEADGPLLMYCWEEEYLNSNFKILFIGQEHTSTEEWAMRDSATPLKWYEKFSLADNYNSVFWQAVKKVNSNLNGDSASRNFLWTNVSKYCSPIGRSITVEQHKYVVDNLDLLAKEIEILKPDVVLFFSGPNYDERIEAQFDHDLKFLPAINGIPVREVALIEHPLFPKHAYRTYHPAALQRQKKGNYVNLMISLIKGYDIATLIEKIHFELVVLAEKYGLSLLDECTLSTTSNSGLYFSKPSWMYGAIGFEFERNGFDDCFYGICRKQMDVEFPNEFRKSTKILKDRDGETSWWPYWKWFKHRTWNQDTFEEVKNGQFFKHMEEIFIELTATVDKIENSL